MTYAEYLKSQGASDEDIKVLDTAIARKAFDKSQADLAAAQAAQAQAVADRTATEDWYRTKAVPEFTAKQNEVIAANANAARYKAALKAAKEQGLVDIDIEDDGTPPAPPNGAHPPVPGIDTSKFVTMDHLAQVADREGDAIAIAQDIAFQHSQLFPDRPLNFRELRREAVAKRISVEQHWKEKYQVDSAIQARDKKRHDDELAKARDEGAKAERERLAGQFNPQTATPMPSSSPFTVRKTQGDIRAKQPWEAPSESVLSDDRVSRVARKILTQ